MGVSELHPKRTQVKANFTTKDKAIHLSIEDGKLTWKVIENGVANTLSPVDTLRLANFLREHYSSIVVAARDAL